MAAVGPTELPEFLTDEEMIGLEATARLDAKASMPDFISDDEMSSLEGGGWNWGDAASQTLSGAIEGIATLPATIGDLNPLDPSNMWNALERVSAVEKPSLWNYMRAAAPRFSKTEAVEKAIDPYLADRDPQYRYLRTAGSFVGPGLFGKGIQAVRQTPGVIRTIGTLFGPEASLRRQLVTDTAAGTGSELASDISGDSPLARLVGAIFGAGSTSAVTDLSKATKRLFTGASPEEIKGTAAKTVQDISGMTPQEMEAAVAARPQDRLGQYMTTAELTESPGLSQLEKTLTSADEGANRLGLQLQQREKTRNEILQNMSNAPRESKEVLGTKLMEKAADVEAQMGDVAEKLWDIVPRKEVIDVAPEQLNLLALIAKRQGGLEVNGRVQHLVGQFLGGEENAKSLTSGALQDIRSDALALSRDANLMPTDQRILGYIQEASDKAAQRGLSPADYDAWTAARDMTRIKAETFKRGTAGGALTEEMTHAAQAPKNAFKGDRRSVQELRQALRADPQMMEAFKRYVINDIKTDPLENLTPGCFKDFLEKNEGGLTDLFGPDQYKSMTRILEDLQSEAKVGKNAFASSKGQSVTQQRQTVAGAIEDAITTGITGAGGIVGKLVQAIKEGAKTKDRAAVKALLTEAIFNADFAIELAKAPTQTRILNGLERLKDAVERGTISGGRASLLSQSRGESDSRLSRKRPFESGRAPSLFGSTGSQGQQRGGTDGQERKGLRAEGKRSAAGEGSLQSAIRQYSSLIPELIPSAAAEPIHSSTIQGTYPVSYTRPNPTQAAFEALAQNKGGAMAGDIDIDALVKAVIGQESAGRADAISPKGAMGLMQIMPATAREIAGELGLDTYDLKDAATNRLMGTYYLRKMLDRFGDPELALAAYNAGPSRVQGWVEKYGPSWADIAAALSKIRAYEETRNYVPRVLARLEGSGVLEV